MIVPMKKVTILVPENKRQATLQSLRKLGVMHIQITEGSGTKLTALGAQLETLEKGQALVADRVKKLPPKKKKAAQKAEKQLTAAQAIEAAADIDRLTEEQRQLRTAMAALSAECDRLKSWGEVDPAALDALRQSGVPLSLYEMPASAYKNLGDGVITLPLSKEKGTVRFVTAGGEDAPDDSYRVRLPDRSTYELRGEIARSEKRMAAIEERLDGYALMTAELKKASLAIQKEAEYETYFTGMDHAALSEGEGALTVAYFTGYLPAEDLDTLKSLAADNAWGLVAADPTPDDDVPTKLKNNKFVSLIYPMTDFLGTVPGYFEYDISGWFLGFILVFFGIIFGDGGYGLLICAGAGGLMLHAYLTKKAVPPAYLLALLLGAATVLWGLVTCTWFGLAPERLPMLLQKLSVPVLSNVYADKLWYPFWTEGKAGLTTSQNVQIFCFTLALIQLSAAHFMAAVRDRRSLKLLGDLGSVLQLVGIYYVVLSLVVNSAVFGLGLTVGGVPIGTVAIALVGVGFVMSFVFSNFEGNLLKAILASMTNIVSVLLGVVNVFSDIVSYIRLWAVGLAGAAISATVNELASPLLGNLLMTVIAIVLLVFGHGLNMILNVLSVIVHGIRLNTLEFSSHLDMSWSGHKYKPFEE